MVKDASVFDYVVISTVMVFYRFKLSPFASYKCCILLETTQQATVYFRAVVDNSQPQRRCNTKARGWLRQHHNF